MPLETLILASQSPRRAELLRQAGIPFVVRVAQVDENPLPGERPEEYVVRLAERKAMAVEAAPEEIVLVTISLKYSMCSAPVA